MGRCQQVCLPAASEQRLHCMLWGCAESQAAHQPCVSCLLRTHIATAMCHHHEGAGGRGTSRCVPTTARSVHQVGCCVLIVQKGSKSLLLQGYCVLITEGCCMLISRRLLCAHS